jgi:cyclohexadieny/prephenate dehydrogenase
MNDALFARIAIIGCGLIGASIARAAKARGLAHTIALYDLSADVRDRAAGLDLGQVCATSEEAARDADLVILCPPSRAMAAAFAAVAGVLKTGAIVTDVGSVKSGVIDQIAPLVPQGVAFIPGHPVAGTEQSGPEAGFATLFDGRWCILTPVEDAPWHSPEALGRLTAFWERLGSTVEIMDPKRHDLVLAITSHVPHLVAFTTVATAADLETVTEGEVVKFSAGGFRDFTRIAASDPVMWRDVFLLNKDAVLEMLGRLSEDLTALRRAIRWGDAETLEKTFIRARAVRRDVIEAGQDSPTVNFGRNENG